MPSLAANASGSPWSLRAACSLLSAVALAGACAAPGDTGAGDAAASDPAAAATAPAAPGTPIDLERYRLRRHDARLHHRRAVLAHRGRGLRAAPGQLRSDRWRLFLRRELVLCARARRDSPRRADPLRGGRWTAGPDPAGSAVAPAVVLDVTAKAAPTRTTGWPRPTSGVGGAHGAIPRRRDRLLRTGWDAAGRPRRYLGDDTPGDARACTSPPTAPRPRAARRAAQVRRLGIDTASDRPRAVEGLPRPSSRRRRQRARPREPRRSRRAAGARRLDRRPADEDREGRRWPAAPHRGRASISAVRDDGAAPRVSWSPTTSHQPARLPRERIYEYNEDATGIDDGRWLGVLMRNKRGAVVAGLSEQLGSSLQGARRLGARGPPWPRHGHPPARRRRGSRRSGAAARQVVLASHSFQAPDFYRKRGFEICAVMRDDPIGHRKVYLRKALAQ